MKAKRFVETFSPEKVIPIWERNLPQLLRGST